MPKWSVKWNEKDVFDPNKKGQLGYTDSVDDGFYQFCKIETWGFRSCACFHLHSFESSLVSRIDATEFWTYVTETLGAELSYNPKEVYFLLSDTQLPRMEKLWDIPNVKKVDSFMNKAHGPNRVHLFRYSVAGDFT